MYNIHTYSCLKPQSADRRKATHETRSSALLVDSFSLEPWAFASICRRNKFGTTSKTVLRRNTVKSTVTHVCQTFRTHLRPDPALDADNKPSLFLTRQIAGFIDADPSKRQKNALTLCVFSTMYKNNFTPMDGTMGQLVYGDFFFGMRSCEYLTFSGTIKTKRLKIRQNQSQLLFRLSNPISQLVFLKFCFQTTQI